MFGVLKEDFKSFRQQMRGQDVIFYLGVSFIIFYYLRPQSLYPQLAVIPWMQLVLLAGFFLMVGKAQLRVTSTHVAVFLFAFIAWLSAQASLYPEISSERLSTPFIFAVEVLFLSNCVRNTQQLKLLLVVYFICLFKMSLFGARTWVSRGFGFTDWGIAGPTGFFQNSGEFSLLMAMFAVMSIPIILALKPRTKLYYILPVTAIMTVLGASSRGSQLALLIGLICLMIGYKKLSLKYLVYAGLLVATIWMVLPEEQKQRFQTAGEDDTSTTRLAYWTAGIDMAKKHPWLGIGYDAFPHHYHYYYKESTSGYLAGRKEAAHNTLVQVVSTLGFPALFLYLFFHFAVLKKLRVKKKAIDSEFEEERVFLTRLKLALNVGAITYFIGAFFMSVAFYPYIYFLLGLTIATRRLYSTLGGAGVKRTFPNGLGMRESLSGRK